MRIASFEIDGREAWGIVVELPETNELWVFEPQKVEEIVKRSSLSLGPWRGIAPAFMPEGWPVCLKEFLGLGKEGMDILSRLQAHLQNELVHGDRFMLMTAGHPLEKVKMLAPVPRPGLLWGLVSNSPYSWRNTERPIINFFPQAHQRSIGSIVSPNGIFYKYSGFNVEMGVIIGKGGRDIPISEAYKHIAGYTTIIDSQVSDYYPLYDDRFPNIDVEGHYGWYVGATCSWMGKNADAHCVIGPYLTTADEVGCPYDLLMYTGQNGVIRDRSHSAGTSLGAERAIAYYSSFATLRPGDIIHLGTVGTDGLSVNNLMDTGRGSTVESEIEKVGHVKAYIYDPQVNDWMNEEEKLPNGDFPKADAALQKNFSPAVRYYLKNGLDKLADQKDWKLAETRNFFICFANYAKAEDLQNELPTRVPRVLNAPATAVTQEKEITLAKRAKGKLTLSAEMAFVVKKLACKVEEEKASEYILGYLPMLSVTDGTFVDAVIEPASPQEHGLPYVYGRWGDGYNMVGNMQSVEPKAGRVSITVNGQVMAKGNLDEYTAMAEKTLWFISRVVTLFPGDIVTLGRLAEQAEVDASVNHLEVDVSIENMESFHATIHRNAQK